MTRKYTRVHPTAWPVMQRLHEEHDLTLPQIADLFGCSRSRVVQIIGKQKGQSDAQPE